MREKAQLLIGVSNREEAMARILSRSNFNEGTVLHAHRAAAGALAAVLAEHGWDHASDRCIELCDMLRAHDVGAPDAAATAAQTLDGLLRKLDAESEGRAPSDACDAKVSSIALECARRIRGFVNAALTE